MEEPREDVSMAGKRCDECCKKNRRLNKCDLVAAGDNAESWSSVFTVNHWLVLLIIACAVEESMACEADQVKVGTKMNYTCVSCVDCPHGMEPSIACGGHGLVLECTPCKPGTFSSAFDKHECRPCTICDDKLTVLQNCTSQWNSKCGGCRLGYYRHDLIPDCLPCSPCCGDGQDVHPPECKTLKGMQCEKRRSHCPPAGVDSPSAPGTNVTPVSPTSTRETFTTQPRPGELIPLTENHDTKDKPTEKATLQVAEIGVAAILPVLACGVVIGLIVIFKRGRTLPCLCARPVHQLHGEECVVEMALVQREKNMPVHFSVPRGVLQPLCDLQSVSLEAYEETLKRLDKKLPGKGHFKNIAKAFGVEQANIYEFENEIQRKNGSPSQLLLEYLASTRPKLTILDFIKVLQLPRVRRKDVVEVLKPYIFQSNSQN